MTLKEVMKKLAKGNPGAMQFLMRCAEENVPYAILSKLQLADITGPDMYVLWSDICDKDMNKVIHLVQNCPIILLSEACSKQDYSGREMVAKYLPE